jgi:hypothetical protein
MKHMPTGAFSWVPMTISFAPHGQDLPAERLRPEPGQAGQIVSVNHDVAELDGHAGCMRGTLDPSPENPLFCPRTPSQLSTWPDGKTITESTESLRTCAKYPPFGATGGFSG